MGQKAALSNDSATSAQRQQRTKDSYPSTFARNDIEQVRKHYFWRQNKWCFTDPGCTHPLVEPFRGRFGINEDCSGLHFSRARNGGFEKNSTDPPPPMEWVYEQVVEQRNSLKRAPRHRDDTDDFADVILGHLNSFSVDHRKRYRKPGNCPVNECLVVSRVHRRTHNEACELALFLRLCLPNRISAHRTTRVLVLMPAPF